PLAHCWGSTQVLQSKPPRPHAVWALPSTQRPTEVQQPAQLAGVQLGVVLHELTASAKTATSPRATAESLDMWCTLMELTGRALHTVAGAPISSRAVRIGRSPGCAAGTWRGRIDPVSE